MATLKQIRDKADAKLVQFWTLLQARQNAYYAKHGKYFQLLISPSVIPVGGDDTDFEVRIAENELNVIDVDFPWSSKVPFQIKVDDWVRKKSNDRGYRAFVWIALPNGEIYHRNRKSNGRDTGWYKWSIDT